MEEDRKVLTEEEKQIRKLRKKLRQIERLELSTRELNEDEEFKVKSKASIREELQKLLKDHHSEDLDIMKRKGANVQVTGIGGKKTKNFSNIDVKVETPDDLQDFEYSNFPSSYNNKIVVDDEMEISANPSSEMNQISSSHGDTPGETSVPLTSVVKEKPQEVERNDQDNAMKSKSKMNPATTSKVKDYAKGPVKTEREFSVWRDSSYQVFTLEGHNDIILSVDCSDNIVLSASRDTTVKVWRVGSTKEERSLRGHTSAVTAVMFLPEIVAATVLRKFELDYDNIPSVHNQNSNCRVLAISGSLDCTIRVWDVHSGESFGSIYTYNGITTMRCGDWGAVTGTEGGKMEIWCIGTGQRVAFVNAFQCQVTALHVEGDRICCGSYEGDIGIWQFNSDSRSLSAIYIMEAESQLFVSLRRLATVVLKEGILYCGDSGPNIKVLDWKKGSVTRFVNHIGDIGMTDSLAVSTDGHLLSSSYFIDTGCSSINIREMRSGKYVCSLIDEDEGRYLTMNTTGSTIVTGGHLLKVWVQRTRPTNASKSKVGDIEIINPDILRKLSGKATESASEDDTDWASSSDEDEIRQPKMASDAMDGNDGGWWCNIL